MALKTKSIQGTRDILPAQSHRWQYVERVALEVAERFGFREIRVPTIEKTELFQKSVGETTDVVQKEMYSFEKGREHITLRPEGTAGTVRAVIQNSLLAEALPVKVGYVLSCFRHERPQAGRYREFHQFGVESFGEAGPSADAEVIGLTHELLCRLGIPEIALQLNSIGCPVCRPDYNGKLVEYYKAHYDQLCPTCRERLERNPLRLLDCKEERCAALAEGAPSMLDSLCEECSDHFAGVQTRLKALDIPFAVNPRIVRGLDYYTKTVFEFVTTKIGAQGTVCGGGRYDLLVEAMGGPPTPALGFAMGLERLLLVMEECGCPFPEAKGCELYLGSLGEDENIRALVLAAALRREGFSVLTDTVGRSVKAQMKFANKVGAGCSCILGSNELTEGRIAVKDMETGKGAQVPLTPEGLRDYLYGRYAARIEREEL